MRLKKEKEASSMETDNLFMRYIMQFGAEELPPRMQMPIEQQTDEFYNALLERCGGAHSMSQKERIWERTG